MSNRFALPLSKHREKEGSLKLRLRMLGAILVLNINNLRFP